MNSKPTSPSTPTPPPQPHPALKERMEALIKDDPRYAELEKRLLALGGQAVVPVPEVDLGKLLTRGQLWPTAGLIHKHGYPHQCHANTAALWFVNLSTGFEIITGWALCDDDLWRQYTWGWHQGHIVQTTVNVRTQYYGFRLTPSESHILFSSNLMPGSKFITAIRLPLDEFRKLLGNAARGLSDTMLEKLIVDHENDLERLVKAGLIPHRK